MIDFEIGFVVGVLSAVFVVCCYKVRMLWQTNDIPAFAAPVEMSCAGDVNESLAPTPNDNSDFSATGKPRIPWHIRRKELEEAARSKRKRLESFQEYV